MLHFWQITLLLRFYLLLGVAASKTDDETEPIEQSSSSSAFWGIDYRIWSMILVSIVDAAQQYYQFGGFPLRIRPFVRDALLVLRFVSVVVVGFYLIQFLQTLVPGVMACEDQENKKKSEFPEDFAYQFMLDQAYLSMLIMTLVTLMMFRDAQEDERARQGGGIREEGNIREQFEPRRAGVDARHERVRENDEAIRRNDQRMHRLLVTLMVVCGLGIVVLRHLVKIMFAFEVAASEVLVDGNRDEHVVNPLSTQSCDGLFVCLTSKMASLTALINFGLCIMALLVYLAAEDPAAAVDCLRNARGYLGKAFKFFAISFAVMVNMIVVVFGCVFIVAPFMGLRCLWRCCAWLAGTICLIVPPLNRYTPIFGIEPLPTPYKKKAPKTDGKHSDSVCSNLAFSVILDQEEANKPIKEVPLEKKAANKMKKRKVLRRTVSEWTIHVAADKERRLRTAVTRGYETDNESATVKKKVIVSKKRRMTLGGGEGTRGCWVAK